MKISSIITFLPIIFCSDPWTDTRLAIDDNDILSLELNLERVEQKEYKWLIDESDKCDRWIRYCLKNKKNEMAKMILDNSAVKDLCSLNQLNAQKTFKFISSFIDSDFCDTESIKWSVNYLELKHPQIHSKIVQDLNDYISHKLYEFRLRKEQDIVDKKIKLSNAIENQYEEAYTIIEENPELFLEYVKDNTKDIYFQDSSLWMYFYFNKIRGHNLSPVWAEIYDRAKKRSDYRDKAFLPILKVCLIIDREHAFRILIHSIFTLPSKQDLESNTKIQKDWLEIIDSAKEYADNDTQNDKLLQNIISNHQASLNR